MSQPEQYWLPGYELSRQVILSNIHIFLGPTASARPYTYHVWNFQPFTNGYITLPFSTFPDTVVLGPRWIPGHWKQTHPSTSSPSLPAGAAYFHLCGPVCLMMWPQQQIDDLKSMSKKFELDQTIKTMQLSSSHEEIGDPATQTSIHKPVPVSISRGRERNRDRERGREHRSYDRGSRSRRYRCWIQQGTMILDVFIMSTDLLTVQIIQYTSLFCFLFSGYPLLPLLFPLWITTLWCFGGFLLLLDKDEWYNRHAVLIQSCRQNFSIRCPSISIDSLYLEFHFLYRPTMSQSKSIHLTVMA